MLLHSINIFLFTDEDTALGASQELVAGEKYHVCPVVHRIQDCGLIHAVAGQIGHKTASHVVDHRKVHFFTQIYHFLQGHLLGEAQDPIVACMDLH